VAFTRGSVKNGYSMDIDGMAAI